MADIDGMTLGRTIASAQDLDIRVDDLLWSLPKRGGTDLQKGTRVRLQAELRRLREFRQYLDTLKEGSD